MWPGRDAAPPVSSGATPQCVLAPVHYEPNYAYPLLVWLHGDAGDERELLEIMPRISLRNYVGVAPRGLPLADSRGGGRWSWPDAARAVLEAEQRVYDGISAALSRYNVHQDRIFLAGQGPGGTLSLQIALNHPGRFAGAASLGGPLPRRAALFQDYDKSRGLPLFIAADGDGPEYPLRKLDADVRLLHAAGAAATVLRYVREEGRAAKACADLNRWIMRIVCARPV